MSNLILDVIWDFDGTLFDTYPATLQALQRTLRKLGIKESDETLLKYLLISEGDTIAYLRTRYELSEDFIHQYQLEKNLITNDMVHPFPFAIEACKAIGLRGRNFILTHRGDSTQKILEHHGMLSYFTEVVTKDYGFKRKPDPESFLYLINKYHMVKETTMIVGDRDCEILGGNLSGIQTCYFRSNANKKSLPANITIDSLKELIEIIGMKKDRSISQGDKHNGI